jgi:hypothetical protein
MVGKDALEAFACWLQQPSEDFPLFELAPELAEWIGAQVPTVRLSAQTLEKNRRHHPELADADYQLLLNFQPVAGQVLREGARALVCWKDAQGRMFFAAMKATQSGQAIYLSSFRHSTPADWARILRRAQPKKTGHP